MTRRFEAPDLGLEVLVLESVFTKIEDWCEKAGRKETGGRIAGHYPRDDTVVVSKVMGPAADSVQRDRTFDTGTEGVEEWLRKHEANGLSYVGEWHSHPSAPPIPGKVDRDTMAGIANDEDYANPNPLLLIMGGDAASGYTPSVSAAFRNDRPFTTFENEGPMYA